jgi:hypothetical protein
MTGGNEAFWATVRKECLLEEMRCQQDEGRMEKAVVRRAERPATQGRRLRARLGHLLVALGRQLEGVASLTTEGV